MQMNNLEQKPNAQSTFHNSNYNQDQSTNQLINTSQPVSHSSVDSRFQNPAQPPNSYQFPNNPLSHGVQASYQTQRSQFNPQQQSQIQIQDHQSSNHRDIQLFQKQNSQTPFIKQTNDFKLQDSHYFSNLNAQYHKANQSAQFESLLEGSSYGRTFNSPFKVQNQFQVTSHYQQPNPTQNLLQDSRSDFFLSGSQLDVRMQNYGNNSDLSEWKEQQPNSHQYQETFNLQENSFPRKSSPLVDDQNYLANQYNLYGSDFDESLFQKFEFRDRLNVMGFGTQLNDQNHTIDQNLLSPKKLSPQGRTINHFMDQQTHSVNSCRQFQQCKSVTKSQQSKSSTQINRQHQQINQIPSDSQFIQANCSHHYALKPKHLHLQQQNPSISMNSQSQTFRQGAHINQFDPLSQSQFLIREQMHQPSQLQDMSQQIGSYQQNLISQNSQRKTQGQQLNPNTKIDSQSQNHAFQQQILSSRLPKEFTGQNPKYRYQNHQSSYQAHQLNQQTHELNEYQPRLLTQHIPQNTDLNQNHSNYQNQVGIVNNGTFNSIQIPQSQSAQNYEINIYNFSYNSSIPVKNYSNDFLAPQFQQETKLIQRLCKHYFGMREIQAVIFRLRNAQLQNQLRMRDDICVNLLVQVLLQSISLLYGDIYFQNNDIFIFNGLIKSEKKDLLDSTKIVEICKNFILLFMHFKQLNKKFESKYGLSIKFLEILIDCNEILDVYVDNKAGRLDLERLLKINVDEYLPNVTSYKLKVLNKIKLMFQSKTH